MEELLHSNFEIESIFATEKLDFLAEDFTIISEKELARISGLKSPNRVLAIAKISTVRDIDWNGSLVLLLDGINDPGNLGTIIRTAKWFGVSDIICTPDCVDAFDRKVVQSTMGALFHVKLTYQDALASIKAAEQHGFSIIGTSMNGTSIYESERTDKTVLVIGSESHGMREDVMKACDELCSIPNFESERKIESLNAGIATAIVLSELTRKRTN